MVPCEEDTMVLMRNEQEHSESEISRTKKKKKQDGTSRPACSWVHFRYSIHLLVLPKPFFSHLKFIPMILTIFVF